MSSSSFAPKYNDADNKLINALHRLHEKSPKLVRSSKYNPPAWPELTLESWKMNEFKYYDIPSPFPTLARGLFTARLDDEDQVGGEDADRHVVVARGYDKFFNIGEVPWTTVSICVHIYWEKRIHPVLASMAAPRTERATRFAPLEYPTYSSLHLTPLRQFLSSCSYKMLPIYPCH